MKRSGGWGACGFFRLSGAILQLGRVNSSAQPTDYSRERASPNRVSWFPSRYQPRKRVPTRLVGRLGIGGNCNTVMLQLQSLSRRFSGEGHSMPNLRGRQKYTMGIGPQGTLPSPIAILNCSSRLSPKSRGHDPSSSRGLVARSDRW
jgi:hypothetical protein